MHSPEIQKISTDSPDTDLVFYCSVCFRGLTSSKDQLQTGVWLTSCGHIVCSVHIFPNGSERSSGWCIGCSG